MNADLPSDAAERIARPPLSDVGAAQALTLDAGQDGTILRWLSRVNVITLRKLTLHTAGDAARNVAGLGHDSFSFSCDRG